METTDFEDVLREAASEVTALDPESLDVAEFRGIRRSAKRRLELCWRHHFWPDLGRIEQRFFKPDYSAATAYAAGDIAYYPPTQKYYQALNAVTGSAPADALGNTALAHWTEAETSYSADTFTLTGVYSQGNQVMYGDQIYKLFAVGPVTAVLPTDATQWGLLVPFDKYVPYEQAGKTALGIVGAAWNANPKTTTRGTELNWSLSENGVQVTTPINFAWLDYRIRAPKLSGDLFDATLVYASGRQVYFSSANTPGNFYTATQTTIAGDSPDSAAAKWAVVQIPRIFHEPLVYGVAADWVKGPGGGGVEDYEALLAMAQESLEEQKSLLVGQQSQRVKTVVRTR